MLDQCQNCRSRARRRRRWRSRSRRRRRKGRRDKLYARLQGVEKYCMLFSSPVSGPCMCLCMHVENGCMRLRLWQKRFCGLLKNWAILNDKSEIRLKRGVNDVLCPKMFHCRLHPLQVRVIDHSVIPHEYLAYGLILCRISYYTLIIHCFSALFTLWQFSKKNFQCLAQLFVLKTRYICRKQPICDTLHLPWNSELQIPSCSSWQCSICELEKRGRRVGW